MKLNKSQWRYVNSKTLGHQFLRGGEDTGKTTAAVYRMINLENNYRLFSKENIIYVVQREEEKKEIEDIYNNANIDLNHKYYSLFSYFNKGMEVYTLEELIEIYSQGYLREIGEKYKFTTRDVEYKLLESFLHEFKEKYKKSKLIQKSSMEFLYKEVAWIKASGFSKEEYLSIERKGREKRIKKDSLSREGIYTLMEEYNGLLRAEKLMDKSDNVLFALEYARKFHKNYTHIILDSCEELTLGEIRFIKELLVNEDYSSLTYILGEHNKSSENAWFIKGRKYNSIEDILINRSFLLKSSYKREKNNSDSIEEFKFIDLIRKTQREFSRDTGSNESEIIVGNGEETFVYRKKELKEYPLFSNIAAGEPILMNENIEGNFFLPKEWLKNKEDIFILKVKGDSMENINILNGDLVVIKKQAVAYNNDIVAVDIERSSTLKRLNTNGKEPLLMPENDKYEPISLKGKEASILGVAIGIIKKIS